jgi:hypothetical protein
MRFALAALVIGLTLLPQLATAGNNGLITITSGDTYSDFSSVDGRKRLEVSLVEDSYRILLRAYIDCQKKGGMPYLSTPNKKASCSMNEFKPRGSYLGSCGFRATAYCVSHELLEGNTEVRLGSDLSDIVSGRSSLENPDGTKVDFSDLAKQIH